MIMLPMRNDITKFAEQFGCYRKKSGLSYRALESVTGIKYSALAAMQSGNRPVGEQSARRIALAFGLSGEPLEAFVLSALGTSKEKILEAVKDYPPAVLNLLGLVLLAHGIKPKHILGCELDSLTPMGLQNGLRVSLRGGRSASLQIALSLEA